jgi:hypothetical protein
MNQENLADLFVESAERVIVVSTIHIPENDRLRLAVGQLAHDGIISWDNIADGRASLVYVPEALERSDVVDGLGWSKAFFNIMLAAFRADCSYVSFDGDGLTIDGLKKFP